MDKYYLRTFLRSLSFALFIGLAFSINEIKANKYYVGNGGSDANSISLAQLPASPWQTLVFAISQASLNDSIVVLPGTYTETNIVVSKGLKLFGNETGGTVGVGVKPVFEGTSGTGSASVFILQSSNIVLRNFEIRVNQLDVIRGIFSNGGGFNGLRIEDNHIVSTLNSVPSVFNSYGIQLGTSSIGAGQDSFLIARNVIRPMLAGNAMFGRGIRLVGGYGVIGGSALADSNYIVGDYGIQAGDIKRTFNASNNHIYGRSAGIELNIPAANRNHMISGNTFEPVAGSNALSMIELKNNTLANSNIRISGNQFRGHQVFGILSTRSRNVFVSGNTFAASDTSKNYIHIAVNTKQQTTATDASVQSGISITGNDFQGNSTLKGTGIAFQNHNSGASPAFVNVVLGGVGAEANQFRSNLGQYLMLDTASGPTTQSPLWNQTGYKTTLMRPVSQSFNLENNTFDLGNGLSVPSAKSVTELLQLEDRIVHGIDYDSLGFVTVRPLTAYVTQQSFLNPLTTAPHLQRGINQAGITDGWSVIAEPGTYAGKAVVVTDMTLSGNGGAISTNTLEMNGSSKTLTLTSDLNLTDSLKLSSGIVSITTNNIRIENGGEAGGGSAGSFVRTEGTGSVTYTNAGAAGHLYPIGTAQGYFPLTVSNAGTADELGIRVQNDVLSGGLTGTPVDSVVNATWVMNEGIAGGSNLSVMVAWSGANEKPLFDRAAMFMQGFTGSWANISDGPVAATGTDPFSGSFVNITSDLVNIPVRIGALAAPALNGRLYYVDDNTGDDTRTNADAKIPTTPWRTIAKALASLADGDSIQIMAGTYPEANLLVDKKLAILGNVIGVGTGVGAGTGVKPIVNGIAPVTLDSAIFIIRDSSVVIKNINIKVDIDRIKIGVYGPFRGFAGLVIEDNLFESTSDFVSGGLDVVVLSHAILLGRITVPNGNGDDSVIVRRNMITREGPTKKWFSRGVRWFGCRGMIGGNTLADGNEVHADFAIQCGGGNFTGRLQTRNNNVFGRAAGIEYNTPPPSFIHTIANNTVQPLDNSGHFALIEIKSNIRTTVPTSPAPPFIDVENNTFIDFYNIGVAITRSRMTRVMNNTFTPRADSTRYTHVWVNSKQRTAGTAGSQPPLSSVETLIQGNTFNSNNVFGGYGIAFQNANRHASGKVFTINNMGGAGALANTFGTNIAKVVYLDTITGPSSDDPFWSKPGVNWTVWPSTPTGPVTDNFDFSENLYDVGTGSKRPVAMSNAELLLLEDRVVHKIEADTLGFVTMKPNHVFVTQQSFIAPLTTSARLQRAVNAGGTVDGVTVNIETGNYNGQTTVAQSLIFDATPDGEVTSEDLGMNGLGKTLTLSDPLKLSSSLRLDNGMVDLGTSDLTMTSAATVTGGSLTSHVLTNGNGFFVNENLAATSKRYPVGTGTRYAETQIGNTGTSDNIGLKVANDVLANGLTGAVQDTVVAITYQIRESIQGNSNLNFSPTWSAADERPVFDRAQVHVEQFNGAWQNIGPNTPSVATGSDPFTASVAISGNWNSQPVRIIGRAVAIPTGNLYYVDDATGDDSRGNGLTINPNTPWKTMTKALASIANGDSVQVFAGTYPEANLTITKSVKLFGNVVGVGKGVGAGTGIKPIFSGTSGTASGSIFILQADSVLLQNFEIRVNQLDVIRGIFCNGGGYNGLQVLDNNIFSTFSGVQSIFNSYGIQLGTTSISAGADSFLISRNIIRPLGTGSATFGRAIRTLGGFGMIGGPTLADSNQLVGDYGVQSGNPTRKFQLVNNHLLGQSACLELNIPAQNQNHIVAGNTFNPIVGRNALSLVEIKNNTRVNSVIEIRNNQFVGHQVFGLFSTRSRNVIVVGNTFTASDTSNNYAHIVVNTKQQTTATEASVTNGIVATGNTFNGNATNNGNGIIFQNHNSGASPAFDNVLIGGSGPAANTFNNGLRVFFGLDTASGPSTQNPLWNQVGYKTTLMRPVSTNFNLENNLFDLGTGLSLPAAKSIDELFLLENKIVHGIDYDSLGFATVNPLSAYVTQQSFVAPLSTTPLLQRGIRQAGINDGWSVFAEPGTYPGKAIVSTNLILTGNGIATPIVTDVLTMNGIGKSLSVTHNIELTDSLDLRNGNVELDASNIVMQIGAQATNGNAGSYVMTTGTGQLQYSSQAATSNHFPLGTSQGYFPLQITNSGTVDALGIRIQNDVFDNGLTGNPVDSVVNATWIMNEGTAGGSNLSVTASWTATNEKNGFDRTSAFMQGFNSGWNEISDGPVAATGSDPFSSTFVNITTDLVNKPVRIGAEVVESVGNLYYVDDATGVDSRTNEEAKDPNTPWKTIANSLARTADGDSIQVFAGTYNESDLRVNNALKIFGNVIGVGTGVGAGTGIKPIVNGIVSGPDSAIFYVKSPNVLINNFQVEVNQSTILYGFYNRNGNINNLRLLNHAVLGVGLNPIPGIPSMVFASYAMRFTAAGTDSVIVKGCIIQPKDGNLNTVFGRGVRGLFGGRFIVGGPAPADTNRIVAFYGVEIGGIQGGPSIIENNFIVGNAVEINAPGLNTGIHQVINNRLVAVFPQFLIGLAQIKNVQNDGTGVNIQGNTFIGHSIFGVMSSRSKNVTVQNNVFIPSDTAKNFRHIYVNTKQETTATELPNISSEITIKGNVFQGPTSNGGVGLEFANHFDDPASTTAFSNVFIGGPGLQANTFDSKLDFFVRLDPTSGNTAGIPIWAASPITTIKPVSDEFDIRSNNFGVSGGSKLPIAMTDAEQYELEDKVLHRIDYDSLGFVTWTPDFAYVTDSSFVRPFTTTPSLQRAVDAAGSNDTWQVNIQPNEIQENVTVSKSIIWNTFPRDSMRLGGINMNGLDKILTLSDKFILTNSLTLNNPNGGKINGGDNDLFTLPSTTVTIGSLNSYVVSNGTGGLVRRGVDDQAKFFPIGTMGTYAPVNFADQNNTGDNFKVTVRPAATNADFIPPLPATITTHVTLEWRICEDQPGGSIAQLTFDWVDPSNVNGTGVINGISRFDGTNWLSVLANIGPGLTAKAQNFSNFCSPFALVSDPSLTLITTENPIKVHPAVAGRYCAGDSIKIPFTVSGTGILPGNSFSAFLSDPDGTFPGSGGVLLGAILSSTSDTIFGKISLLTVPGSNYRIRVVSDQNPITGLANPDSIKIFGLPARPTITGDSSICQGETTTLTSSPSSSYRWTPNGEITSSIPVVATGAFSVTISDINGCENTSAVTNVSVLATPVAQPITFTGALTRCDGDTIRLTANPAGFTYTWLTTPTFTGQTLTVTTSGTFRVELSNAAGCKDTSDAVTTVFNANPPKPIITVTSANDTICQPATLNFSTVAGFQYNWNLTGLTPNPTTQAITISIPGSYMGTVTITDAITLCQNTSDSIRGLLKKAPNAPTITSVGNDLSVCEGETIELVPSGFSNANTYTWLPGPFTGSPFIITVPGSVTVSLSVDSVGCTTAANQSVTANINPRAVKPTITLGAGQNATFCNGDSVSLISSGAISYLWTPGGKTDQIIFVKSTGNYSVVTQTDSGCNSLPSDPISILVKQNPQQPLVSTTSTRFCADQSATLTVTNPFTDNTYTWNPPPGTGLTIDVNTSGIYSVRSDSTNGCFSLSDPIEITVDPLPVPIITALDGKTEVCQGESVVLSSNFQAGNLWSTSATTQSITLTQSTPNITLKVTDANGCVGNAVPPVNVIVNPLPTVTLFTDTAIVFGEDLVLQAIDLPSSGITEFDWSKQSGFLQTTTTSSYEVVPKADVTEKYYVTVIDANGCKAKDSVLVRVGREVFVPNVFSPNGDGNNDNFKVYGFGVASIKVEVWDRLGNLIYETNNVSDIVETSETDDSVKGWDGKYKGTAVGQESYIWNVSGKLTTGEDIKVRGGKNSGSVIIMN